jgi:hypothetical protein
VKGSIAMGCTHMSESLLPTVGPTENFLVNSLSLTNANA